MGEAKKIYMKEHVKALKTDGLDAAGLKSLCKEIHDTVAKLEEEKYDVEMEIRMADAEIYECNLQMSNQRGVFVKPNLKKVSKTDMKFAKLQREPSMRKGAIQVELKSSGKSKYALEDEKKSHKSESETAEEHQPMPEDD